MADTIPSTTTDPHAPPAATEFEPAAPLANAGVAFDADDSTVSAGASADSPSTSADGAATKVSGAAQLLKDGASKFGKEASDKARAYAEDGKVRAGTALDDLVKMMNDAAGTVDEKLGEQYGQYARSAADQVASFSQGLKAKELDDLIEDARGFVQKSPAVAIGTAAALGFVLVRLLQSGLSANRDDA